MMFLLKIKFMSGAKYECLFKSSADAMDRLGEFETMGYGVIAWSVERIEAEYDKAN